MTRTIPLLVAMLVLPPLGVRPVSAAELGVQGTQFTIDGQPRFLLGISAYGALGAPEGQMERDLDEMGRRGFNWLRAWATWAAFDHDVSAVHPDGTPRRPYLDRLRHLVEAADRRGIIVDVTLSRDNGVTGPPRLQDFEDLEKAVRTIVEELKPLRNWYLDLGNERNIRDERYVAFADLKALRTLVRRLDPDRLVTASHAGDIAPDDLPIYIETVGVDFLAPHRPRTEGSPGQTETRTRTYLDAMTALDRVVPVHYQAPFRRGFGEWDPTAEDYLTDLRGAIAGGAAGWCLHNGDQRMHPEGRPRRSFDLREHGLFEGLDPVEQQVVGRLPAILDGD